MVTWLPAFSPVLVAPPATNGRVGGPAKHRLSAPINPFSTVSGLGPALSPSLQASPLSRGCRGEGRKFLGSEASRALPQSPEPPPPEQLPARGRSPDRGCPALGTRNSSESVASSVALVPLSLLCSSRGPRPLPHPCSFRRAVPCSSRRRLAALAFASHPGRTPPPSVQLCSRRPFPLVQLRAARPFLEVPDVHPELLEGSQLRGGSAAPDLRSALPSVTAAPLSPRCAGDQRARPSLVLIPQTRRPLPPRRGAPPGGRPWPRRARPRLPAQHPPDWSAPGVQSAPASSSLPQAAAAAAVAGTMSPTGTSRVNSSPAGPQPGDPRQRGQDAGVE